MQGKYWILKLYKFVQKKKDEWNTFFKSLLHKWKMQNSHSQHSLHNIHPHLSHYYVSWQTALIHWTDPKYQAAPHGRTNGVTDPTEQKVGLNAAFFKVFNMNEKAAVSNGVGVGTYCEYLSLCWRRQQKRWRLIFKCQNPKMRYEYENSVTHFIWRH